MVGMTRPRLRFRPAEDPDVPAVTALVESAYRGDASRAGWTTEADLLGGQRTDAATVRAIVESPDALLLLVEAGDELLACCQLERRADDICYFGSFAVRPDRQGAGVGRATLDHAERLARRRWDSRWMEMTVIAQRAELIAWYERRGYAATGETRPFPYGDTRFGLPKRDDLSFTVLRKPIAG